MGKIKFSPAKTITRANLAAVPEGKPGVYRITTANKEIVYVGMAQGGRLPERIAEHKGEFPGGTRFQVKTTASKDAAKTLEAREIAKHEPKHNDQGK
jgi:excinuclease UvrABC nuclease subunit